MDGTTAQQDAQRLGRACGAERPFVGWCGWQLFGWALLLGTGQSLWWLLIYGGANYLTEQHAYRVRLHLDAELAVPFVPAAVLVYLSIYPLFWLGPFVLRSRRELVAINLAQSAVIVSAGVCFLLFPGDNFFPTPSDLGYWTVLVQFAKQVALPHNLAPSLHVALSVTCVAVYARHAGPSMKVALWSWAAAMGVSTLLLHQHYVVDVVTGFLLGLVGVWLVYDRFASARAGNKTASP